ncbi:MAG: hypothetical protein ACRDZZ_14185, partial [Ilumatobacteraceae bacterium]
ARSNGTSEVLVELHTPSGSAIGEPIALTARVNALRGLGQLLTGAALLVLVTWWFSHFRRTRRERHSEPSRNGHPSNGAPRDDGSGEPTPSDDESGGEAASEERGDRSRNGDEVSPDAAVSALRDDTDR